MFNAGIGDDFTIRELVEMVCGVVGFDGKLLFDTSKPDSTPRKWLDVNRLANLGWRAKIGLRNGVADTYRCYLEQRAAVVPLLNDDLGCIALPVVKHRG